MTIRVETGDVDEEVGQPLTLLADQLTAKPLEEEEKGAAAGREQWSNSAEYIMSCLAMSVGLGNVWRFPIVVLENGGGAFLIPYLVILVLIGGPLYCLEIALGQFSSCGNVKVWRMVPAVKGLGVAQMLVTWAVVTYYSSLMAITVFYLVQSCRPVLPWSYCDPAWADEYCVDASTNVTDLLNVSQSSSEQYFMKHVLKMADSLDEGLGAPDLWLSLCLLAVWIMIFFNLMFGVKSLGKVAYFVALFPYVVLVIMLARGLTLEGAGQGLLFLFTPNWAKIVDPAVWFAAVSQAFFSLSVGFGTITAYSSFNDFHFNFYKNPWVVSAADGFTSLMASVATFSVLGNMAHQAGVAVDEVVRAGSGLAFISYPEALASFGIVPQLFAVLFFLMFLSLAQGTAVAFASNIITIVGDFLPGNTGTNRRVTAVTCIISFFVSLIYVTPGGQWMLELIDYFGAGVSLFLLALVEVAAVSYCYGVKNFIRDINVMLEERQLGTRFWTACWAGFIPGGMVFLMVFSLVKNDLPTFYGKTYPAGFYAIGWLLLGAVVLILLLGFLHALYNSKGHTCTARILRTFKSSTKWGPRNHDDRMAWEEKKMKTEENRKNVKRSCQIM